MTFPRRIGEKKETLGACEMLPFSILLAIAVSGLLHASWWTMPIGAALLSATLMAQDARTLRALANANATELVFFAGLSRIALSTTAALAAFLLGQASALLFAL
jgi:hypothetical protein